MLDTLALWLATYALHSTLLLLSAWCFARVFPAARERLWRLALFGGLLTAGIDAGGYWPRFTYLGLPGLTPAARTAMAPPSGERAITAGLRVTEAGRPRSADRAGAPARTAAGSSIAGAGDPIRPAVAEGASSRQPSTVWRVWSSVALQPTTPTPTTAAPSPSRRQPDGGSWRRSRG